jgi:hypothetical protein
VCETGCGVCVSYCWPGIDSQHHLPLQEALMRSRIGSRGALVLAVALGGCGDDDTFSPTMETVAGSYSAATFTVTSAAVP